MQQHLRIVYNKKLNHLFKLMARIDYLEELGENRSGAQGQEWGFAKRELKKRNSELRKLDLKIDNLN